MKRFAFLLLLVTSPLARAAEPLDGFDAFIRKAMKDQGVPGLAVAIVKDDKIVFAKGYGVRTLGTDDAVTAETRFAIGSVTKSFTAAALGTLVDAGKLAWDDKVTAHLPAFQMYDPYVTREITLRDLLAHRCGLERHEAVWYGSPDDRATLLKKLRLLKPDFSFRAHFAYQNMMYLVAGEIIPAVTKTSWDVYVAENLFAPLGMTGAVTGPAKLPKGGDVASPHEKIEGTLTVIPRRDIDNVAAAGNIYAGAGDLARWLRFHLGRGKFAGKRMLEKSTLDELHMAQTVIPVAAEGVRLNESAHPMSYALGWMLSDVRGKQLVEHGGAIDGFIAQVGFLPEEKLGIVVLANRGGTILPPTVMYDVIDRFLGHSDKDWADLALTFTKVGEMSQKSAEWASRQARVKDTTPSRPFEDFAGTYADKLHAPMVVAEKKGALTVTFLGETAAAEHWHYDTFRARDTAKRFPPVLVTFTHAENGAIGGAKMTVFGETLDMKRQTK